MLKSEWKKPGLIVLSISILILGSILFGFQNCSGEFQAVQNHLALSKGPPEVKPVYADCANYIINEPVSTLSGTCLHSLQENLTRGVVRSYANFFEFTPQYPLYSDSASKRRWIYIPVGSKIDTSDPDNWVFPVGTMVWKEFSLGGKKLETRQIEKISDGVGVSNWRFSVYVWKVDQMEADIITASFSALTKEEIAPYAAADFYNSYRVGNPSTCVNCHSGVKDGVQGFSYLQLSKSGASFNVSQDWAKSFLSVPPVNFDQIPGSEQDKMVIGYLQTNCSTCHNGIRHPLSFRHRFGATSLMDENVIQVARSRENFIVPGDPTGSTIYQKFSSGSMPPGFLINKDQAYIESMKDWIFSMNSTLISGSK